MDHGSSDEESSSSEDEDSGDGDKGDGNDNKSGDIKENEREDKIKRHESIALPCHLNRYCMPCKHFRVFINFMTKRGVWGLPSPQTLKRA